MSVPCTCPHCKATFNVKDKYVGRQGACPKCRGKIHIHTDGSVTAPSAAADEQTPPPRGKPRQQRPTPAQKIVEKAIASKPAADGTLRIRCKTCGSEQRVRSEWAGRKVKCSVCGAGFRVPGAAQSQRAPSEPAPTISDDDDYLLDMMDDEALGASTPALTMQASGPTLTMKSTASFPVPWFTSSAELLQFVIPMGLLIVAAFVGWGVGNALMAVALAVSAFNLTCLVLTFVYLFRNNKSKLAYRSLLLIPCCSMGVWFAFFYGWSHSGRFGNRGIMLTWTTCLLISFSIQVVLALGSGSQFAQRLKDRQASRVSEEWSPQDVAAGQTAAGDSVVKIDVRVTTGDDFFDLSRKFVALTDGPGRSRFQAKRGGTLTYHVSPVTNFNRFAGELEDLGTVRADSQSRAILLTGVKLQRIQGGLAADKIVTQMEPALGPAVVVAFRSSHKCDRLQLANDLLDIAGGQGHCMWIAENGLMFVAPVRDLNSYASRLTMGEVKGVNAAKRSIMIQLYPQSREPTTNGRAVTQTKPDVEMEQVVPHDEDIVLEPEADSKPSDPIEAAILDLTTGNVFEVGDAAEQLARTDVEPQRQSDVVGALVVALKRHGGHAREEIFVAMELWWTPEHLDDVIELMGEGDVFTQRDCMKFVAKVGEERGAEVLAAMLPHPEHGLKEALKKMGPVAEDAILPFVTHPTETVRRDACEILEVIGTTKSLKEINKLSRDRSIGSRRAAEKAYYAIEWREKQKGPGSKLLKPVE